MVVHAPQSWSGAALNELTEALRATGYSIRSPVRVRFKISRDNVRYFHASDAEAAAALPQRSARACVILRHPVLRHRGVLRAQRSARACVILRIQQAANGNH